MDSLKTRWQVSENLLGDALVNAREEHLQRCCINCAAVWDCSSFVGAGLVPVESLEDNEFIRARWVLLKTELFDE